CTRAAPRRPGRRVRRVIAGARSRASDPPAVPSARRRRPGCRAAARLAEDETTFHFRRRGDTLRLAITEPQPRWTSEQVVDESLVADCRARLAHRYPSAADAPLVRAWAGLYDMTPDAHPVIGWAGNGVYVACGFAGHGFMQAPAVGRAVADELLGHVPPLDLEPYRLERFAT